MCIVTLGGCKIIDIGGKWTENTAFFSVLPWLCKADQGRDSVHEQLASAEVS